MKKVLYFFPLNLMKKNSGSIYRAWTLVHFFRKNEFQVDYIYSNDFFAGEPIDDKDVRELKNVVGFNDVFSLKKRPDNKFSYDYFFKYKIHKVFRKLFKKKDLVSFVTPYSQSSFNKILKKKAYDYIIVSYAYWANLIKENPLVKNAKLIVDTHDFLSSQDQDHLDIGKAFKEEIGRMNLFDEIWTVSIDESYLFSQFSHKQVRLVPISFNSQKISNSESKEFDLIYVAGDNPHNVRAAIWFFDEVYPHLKKHLKLCVIGKIIDWIPEAINITKISFVDSLSEYYERSRIAICPMLSGTGIKVKVVEALSYGLPVICSARGVDGLVNKTENGCVVSSTPTQFVNNINFLLDSIDEYNKIQQQAINFFENHYSTRILFEILDEAFDTNRQ